MLRYFILALLYFFILLSFVAVFLSLCIAACGYCTHSLSFSRSHALLFSQSIFLLPRCYCPWISPSFSTFSSFVPSFLRLSFSFFQYVSVSMFFISSNHHVFLCSSFNYSVFPCIQIFFYPFLCLFAHTTSPNYRCFISPALQHYVIFTFVAVFFCLFVLPTFHPTDTPFTRRSVSPSFGSPAVLCFSTFTRPQLHLPLLSSLLHSLYCCLVYSFICWSCTLPVPFSAVTFIHSPVLSTHFSLVSTCFCISALQSLRDFFLATLRVFFPPPEFTIIYLQIKTQILANC